MTLFATAPTQWVCAAQTCVLAVLVLAGARAARVYTAVCLLVVITGLGNILWLSGKRVSHSNQAHYYVGSKYPLSYFGFYRVIAAAREEPQLGYRDLTSPNRMLREDPRAQRLYYLDLLAEAGLPAGEDEEELEGLAERCREEGLIRREAEAILAEAMPAERIASLQSDLARSRLDTDDMGFNASPFYVLGRHLDPTLYFPFGSAVFVVNLAAQLGALVLMALLCCEILDWTRRDVLFFLALAMASWDYVGWALNGLVTAGWMLPVLVALWGYRRRRAWIAGPAIAWAGLIKLFPLLLTLPMLILLARWCAYHMPALRRAGAPPSPPEPLRRAAGFALRTLVLCTVSLLVLGGLSRFSGYAWPEFLDKIAIQFQHAEYTGNGVGLSHLFLSLGVPKGRSPAVAQLLVLLAAGWMFWTQPAERPVARLAPTTLVLIACMVWLSQTWLNYYAVIALFLLPGLTRTHARWGAAMLLLYVVTYSLHDFGRLYPGAVAVLSLAKVAVYLTLPLLALIDELRRAHAAARESGAGDRVGDLLLRYGPAAAGVGAGLAALAILAEVTQSHLATAWYMEAQALQAQDRLGDTERLYRKTLRLMPGNAQARFNLAYVLDAQGRLDEAAGVYQRALEQDPDLTSARVNLAILRMQSSRPADALPLLREAVEQVPYDASTQFLLGQALQATDQPRKARARYREALRIQPEFSPARAALEDSYSLGSGSFR